MDSHIDPDQAHILFAEDQSAGRVEACRKLSRFLLDRRIEVNEYLHNMLINIVNQNAIDMRKSIETIPVRFLIDFFEYIVIELCPVDFMPSPHGFVSDFRSTESIESTKIRMRDNYLMLYKITKEQILNRLNPTND